MTLSSFRILEALSLICNAGYLFVDHLLILNASKLLSLPDSPRWARISNQFWLASILHQLVSDFVKLGIKLKQSVTFKGVVKGQFDKLYELEPIFLSIVKNLMNMFLPLAALGYVKRKGFVGVCGVGSSYINMLPLLK